MTQQQQEIKLLVDLTKLLKKYGLETFFSLSKMLSSQELSDELSKILFETGRKSQVKSRKKRKASQQQKISTPRVLRKFETTEEETYKLLERFFIDLNAESVLPTLNDIREFSIECGLPEVTAKSRKKAINPLLNALGNFSKEEIRDKIQLARRMGNGDRSLESWSKIILQNEKD